MLLSHIRDPGSLPPAPGVSASKLFVFTIRLVPCFGAYAINDMGHLQAAILDCRGSSFIVLSLHLKGRSVVDMGAAICCSCSQFQI